MDRLVDGQMDTWMKIYIGVLVVLLDHSPLSVGMKYARQIILLIHAATFSPPSCYIPFCHWTQVQIKTCPVWNCAQLWGWSLKNTVKLGQGVVCRTPRPSCYEGLNTNISSEWYSLNTYLLYPPPSFLTLPSRLPHSIYWHLKLWLCIICPSPSNVSPMSRGYAFLFTYVSAVLSPLPGIQMALNTFIML